MQGFSNLNILKPLRKFLIAGFSAALFVLSPIQSRSQSIDNSGDCNANVAGGGNNVYIYCNGFRIDPSVSITLSHEGKDIYRHTMDVTVVIKNNSDIPIVIDDFFYGIYDKEVNFNNYTDLRQSPGDLHAGSALEGETISRSSERRVSLTYRMSDNAVQYWRGKQTAYIYVLIFASALLTEEQDAAVPLNYRYRLSRYEWLRWNVPVAANRSSLGL